VATKNQSAKLLTRYIYKKLNRPKLAYSPQRRTTVLRLRIITPRKPNSARRPTIKGFMSSKKKVLSYLPGAGHTIRRHSKVIIRGGGARDLPVVNYTCMRGLLDFEPLRTKKRRSLYGLKRPLESITHVRRRYRNLVD